MSSDTLTWLLTKNTSSFLVKRNGNEFAREKFNLLNRNCRKYSGLASTKAVDISLADKKITLSTKIEKATKKPTKAVNAVPLRKGARGGANTIRANISRNYYRRDLKKAALAKWSRLSTVAKVEKGAYRLQQVSSRRRPSAAVASRLKLVALDLSSAALGSVDHFRGIEVQVCDQSFCSREICNRHQSQFNSRSQLSVGSLMPFLRSLEVESSQELRSSKTLIGSGSTTCDVVISGASVLELHALLNLSSDKASATLVPFSVSAVCYVNDVVAPREGAMVVHGDRVAFGSPHNAFVFELIPHPQMKTVQESIETDNSMDPSGKRAFRKALDTLRGDRKSSIPNASVAASLQSNLQATRNRSTISSTASSMPSLKSKNQLSRFLLEASTDSLLSDYVDRKLKQRNANSSVASYNQSESPSRASNSVRQSREQRNLAEVEKLRLSQRIREVNDVLNGDTTFQESYLSPSSRRSSLWPNETHKSSGRDSVIQADRSDGNDEKDEEDELPAMMEKAASFSQNSVPASLSVSIQTEHSDENDSSSPSQSNNPPKARSFFSKAMELGFNDLARSHSRTIKTERQEAAKTALQQKIISQTIQRKRNEIMTETFVRWKRGLRIQNENRERKGQQLVQVRVALDKLRRDQYFIRWRTFAALSGQVIVCRLDAFQQRCKRRLVRKTWAALCSNYLNSRQLSKLLHRLIARKATVARQSAFRHWQRFKEKSSVRNQLSEVQRVERYKLKIHLARMAIRHHNQRIVQPLLANFFRRWKERLNQRQRQKRLTRMSERHYSQRIEQPLLAKLFRIWIERAGQRRTQRQILHKILVRGASKLTQRALRKWIEVALAVRVTANVIQQSEQQIQQSGERLLNQHNQAQTALKESHAQQLQNLMTMIEKKNQELEKLQRQQRALDLQKVAARKKREHVLRSYFESAVVKCDEQIAQASDQLENLLQSAESDILGARFGAAQLISIVCHQFLVDSILQQKLHNANEYIHLQETVFPFKFNSEDPVHDCVSELSSNDRFLYDMLQQVRTILQFVRLSSPFNVLLFSVLYVYSNSTHH
ncbi:60S ribosomal protein L28-1 [Phytophthora citrophthora]|uniref:60S ribosomal protein L28-1 n=1 Tax=Phytophthora citrophthora TaxID=4793 RepID=A0AAD9LV37_9STRA|nr:60S ribosomal protein L28-1 [Phytophthora citrophthora]